MTGSEDHRIIAFTSNLFRNLEKLRAILRHTEDTLGEKRLQNERDNLSKFEKWVGVKDELTRRPLITTLLPGEILSSLSNIRDELIVFCRKAGSPCSFSEGDIVPWLSSDFWKCNSFHIMKGEHVDEATSQGIRNGITFIILAGTKMIDQNTHFGKLMSIPGFDNSLNPSSGTDGIRISIHEDTTYPNPSLEGIDIPPGVSAMIGVVSKEIHRLALPYSNCTSENMEIQLLTDAMRRNLKKMPETGHNVINGSYRIADCRSTCLQR